MCEEVSSVPSATVRASVQGQPETLRLMVSRNEVGQERPHAPGTASTARERGVDASGSPGHSGAYGYWEGGLDSSACSRCSFSSPAASICCASVIPGPKNPAGHSSNPPNSFKLVRR
jgi:hypothetical protein